VDPVVTTPGPDTRDTQMRDLHAWLTEWVEATRTVTKRRDILIRLGIGRRRPHAATV